MVKAVWKGVVIAESDDTVVVEGNHYFPETSLKREYVSFSNHRSSDTWKGQAHYYSLFVNGEMNPDAVWYYPEPSDAAAQIKGRVAFWKGVIRLLGETPSPEVLDGLDDLLAACSSRTGRTARSAPSAACRRSAASARPLPRP